MMVYVCVKKKTHNMEQRSFHLKKKLKNEFNNLKCMSLNIYVHTSPYMNVLI